MKMPSSLKKPLYSALTFFGTLIVLSIGYAALSSGLTTSDRVNTGSGLTSSSWNRIVNGVLELDTRTAPISSSGGNVGIGTTNPWEKLEVNGNIKLSGSAKIINPGFALFDRNGMLTSGAGPVRLDNYNLQLIADGGSNSAYSTTSTVGSYSGPFTVSAQLSYSWGWAIIGVAALDDFIDGRYLRPIVDGTYQPIFRGWCMNNNSNNQWMSSSQINSLTTTYSTPITGFASGTHIIYRDSSNNIYCKTPTGTSYLVGNYAGNMKVFATIQAPAWVTLLSITTP